MQGNHVWDALAAQLWEVGLEAGDHVWGRPTPPPCRWTEHQQGEREASRAVSFLLGDLSPRVGVVPLSEPGRTGGEDLGWRGAVRGSVLSREARGAWKNPTRRERDGKEEVDGHKGPRCCGEV